MSVTSSGFTVKVEGPGVLVSGKEVGESQPVGKCFVVSNLIDEPGLQESVRRGSGCVCKGESDQPRTVGEGDRDNSVLSLCLLFRLFASDWEGGGPDDRMGLSLRFESGDEDDDESTIEKRGKSGVPS